MNDLTTGATVWQSPPASVGVSAGAYVAYVANRRLYIARALP